MRSNRPVAILWAAFPFVVLGSFAAGGGRFTGGVLDAVIGAASFVAIEAGIILSGMQLVHDRMWARRSFATAAVVLAIYCTLLGLWTGPFWGPAVIDIAATGVALGVYTIVHMAWVTLQR